MCAVTRALPVVACALLTRPSPFLSPTLPPPQEQYGVGYHLTVSKQTGCVAEHVIAVVEEHVPDAKVRRCANL